MVQKNKTQMMMIMMVVVVVATRKKTQPPCHGGGKFCLFLMTTEISEGETVKWFSVKKSRDYVDEKEEEEEEREVLYKSYSERETKPWFCLIVLL